jgi:hypothetical protein
MKDVAMLADGSDSTVCNLTRHAAVREDKGKDIEMLLALKVEACLVATLENLAHPDRL